MKKINVYILTILFAFIVSFQVDTLGAEKGNRKSSKPNLSKANINPAQSVMNINNITSWVGQDGFHDWVVASSWNGAYPKGASVGAIFAEGIVWGGKVSDGGSQLVRVNGNTYGTGCAPITRVFRVRPDYATGDLSSDAASFFDKPLGSVTESDIQQIRDQYATDWAEWPADEGALYKDVNENGQYDPDVDVPGIPGAAQTLFVKYDDSKSTANYGSIPIGLEVSETYWAYAYSGALGNVIYKKVDIVYTGTPTSAPNSRVDSMFIVQWADSDLGNAGDDFAGCDTSLNLGYSYNSSAIDATYESAGYVPPAIGYDFLQGVSQFTGNPADSAIFNLKWRKGYKYVNEKPMSSFVYFAAGGSWEDPGFDYDGTLEFYNLMRGRLPIPSYPSSVKFPEAAATYTPTGAFLLPGDPVEGTGKLDGSVDTPGDRRLMVTNGPITMTLGDTAQVVVALVGAFGSDYLNSVTQLKQNDATAQIVFDQLFKLPSLEPPAVSVTPMPNSVILNWGNNQQSISNIESFEDQNYKFEGYLVYQLPTPSSSIEEGVLLDNYDVVNGVTAVYDTTTDKFGTSVPELVVPGTDNGLKRYIQITEDAIRGGSLKDGQTYYFAVVAYAVNPSPLLPFHALKSSAVTLTVTPQQPQPGVRYSSVVGDTLSATHDTGTSDGSVIPIVIDPSQTTGDSYKVTFENVEGQVVWNVTNTTTGTVSASGITNQSNNSEYPIVDGVMVKVTGPNPGIVQASELNANDEVVDANVSYVGPSGSLGTTGYIIESRAGNFNDGDRTFDRFRYWGADDIIFDFTQESLTWDYISEEVHIDQATGQPYMAPFAVYRRVYPSGEMIRLFAGFWDTDSSGVWNVDGDNWSGPVFGAPSYEPVYCWQGYDADGNEISYDPANDAQYVTDNSLLTSANTTFGDATGEFDYPFITATLFTMYSDGATLPIGNKVIFLTTKPNSDADVFSYSTPENSSDTELAKADVERINVFPNPYYGTHSRETSRTNHYVTFNHLPNDAVIRIFDLSGVLVKTINHAETGGQFDTWNLQNESGYPVASGIYIVYVDMPELGKTKILKLAVVQEQQILQIY